MGDEMIRLSCIACAAAVLIVGLNAQQKMFGKYKPIQAYEIRPNVLAIPRQAVDGQICEVRIEKIGAALRQHEIEDITEELAPVAERGRRWKGLDTGVVMGMAYTGETVYEDVTIASSGGVTSTLGKPPNFDFTGPFIVTIEWTKRKCNK